MVSSQRVFSSFFGVGRQGITCGRAHSPEEENPPLPAPRRRKPGAGGASPAQHKAVLPPVSVRLLPCNNSAISVWASVSVPVCSGVTMSLRACSVPPPLPAPRWAGRSRCPAHRAGARNERRIFDALQEIFGQDIRRPGPLFQRFHRKARPEHPGRQPPAGSMQEQLLTDRQRTPHRVLLDKRIFAEPPVRPLRQGFFGGSDGSGKLWAPAHAEADGSSGLGGIGGGLRELVQQAHRPAVVLRFDEKGADHAFLGIFPVEKRQSQTVSTPAARSRSHPRRLIVQPPRPLCPRAARQAAHRAAGRCADKKTETEDRRRQPEEQECGIEAGDAPEAPRPQKLIARIACGAPNKSASPSV